jgi:hypothetical protein
MTDTIKLFDTITFLLPADDYNIDPNLLQSFHHLERYKQIGNSDGEIVAEQGVFNNLHIKQLNKGIKVSGSFPKFLYDINTEFLSIEELRQSIVLLNNSLGLDFKQAKISRLDFGVDIITDKDPSLYLPHLLSSNYFTGINTYPNSKTFINTNRTKILYKKSQQLEGVTINRLRFEIRYKSKFLKRIFKKELLLGQLLDKNIINQLIESVDKEFRSIITSTDLQFQLDTILSPNDFYDYIITSYINEIGLNRVEQLIREIRATGGLQNPVHSSRIMKKLHRSSIKFCNEHAPSLKKELRTKVKDKLNLYRCLN